MRLRSFRCSERCWSPPRRRATPTTLAYSGFVSFVNTNVGLDTSIQLLTPLSGTLVVDFDASLPDRPDDPNFPNEGLHYVQVDRFDLSVGDYVLDFSGMGSVVVFDEDVSFSADLVRIFLGNLGSAPQLGFGGELGILIDFGDETREFVTSTDFLFPLDRADWTSAGFALRETIPGTGLQTKFFGSIESWQVVPEPSTGWLLCTGLLGLGAPRAIVSRARSLARIRSRSRGPRPGPGA